MLREEPLRRSMLATASLELDEEISRIITATFPNVPFAYVTDMDGNNSREIVVNNQRRFVIADLSHCIVRQMSNIISLDGDRLQIRDDHDNYVPVSIVDLRVEWAHNNPGVVQDGLIHCRSSDEVKATLAAMRANANHPAWNRQEALQNDSVQMRYTKCLLRRQAALFRVIGSRDLQGCQEAFSNMLRLGTSQTGLPPMRMRALNNVGLPSWIHGLRTLSFLRNVQPVALPMRTPAFFATVEIAEYFKFLCQRSDNAGNWNLNTEPHQVTFDSAIKVRNNLAGQTLQPGFTSEFGNISWEVTFL
jgi:hypothetical protein